MAEGLDNMHSISNHQGYTIGQPWALFQNQFLVKIVFLGTFSVLYSILALEFKQREQFSVAENVSIAEVLN